MSKTKTVLGQTLEEIKEQYAKDFERASFEDMLWSYAESENGISDFIMITDEVAERYAQSQTQELIEQNKELVSALKKILDFKKFQRVEDFISIEELEELLTKYNHLKSNTNGKL
ncbi:hypothetical protein [Sphingobacterium sp. 1.A.4]|uniref:hypothetical protein n=1 Tax=Sphingobacterium sp. 1.A.4 TaxID=2044603 RepID=UPI000C0BFEFE|nr:hypothetical protein [Sphingobacterium sp. 1.A.4]